MKNFIKYFIPMFILLFIAGFFIGIILVYGFSTMIDIQVNLKSAFIISTTFAVLLAAVLAKGYYKEYKDN